MTKLEKAILIIEEYQEWRLGADTEMLDPKCITSAINVVLDEIKK